MLVLWLLGAGLLQTNAQSSPTFKSTPVTTVRFDENYQYTVQTSDLDNDPVSVVATSLPTWLSITHQPVGLVTTFAGSGSGTLNGTGTAASFNGPHGIVFDSKGNLLIADQGNYRIRKISPEGVVDNFVGFWRGYDDGLGLDARFRGIRGMAIDANDNLLIADEYRIRKVAPNGLVTTIAGGTGSGYSDGTGTDALFSGVYDIDLDSQGNLYVADYSNNRIRKVTPEGVVSTFAGSGSGTNSTGTGTLASFWRPQSLVIDESDNIYVGNYISSRIVKITPQGVVSQLSGISVDRPNDLALDKDGNLYVGDEHRIRKISPQGIPTILAGSGSGSADGTFTTAQFKNVRGIAIDELGNVFVADDNHRIRKVNTEDDYLISGDPSNEEGNHSISLTASDGNGGTAIQNFNLEVVVPRSDPSFISVPTTSVGDDRNYQYSVIIDDAEQGEDVTVTALTKPSWLSFNRTYDGVVTTIAGGGTGNIGDGTGTEINIGFPQGITIDSKGNLYFIQLYNDIIKKVTPEGVVTTFAGAQNSALPRNADGTGTNAQFSSPVDLTIDNADNIYVADASSGLIRKISPEGVVSTFIGVEGNSQSITDGTGSDVSFANLQAIDIDDSGNLYVIDSYFLVRKITQQGVATTLAGGHYETRDGQGTEAGFSGITTLAVDQKGIIYVTGTGSKRVRKISPDGLVSTLAGYTGVGDPIDGTGVEATFSQPYSLTVDEKGNVYVLDNIWMRKVTQEGVVTTIAGGIDGFADGAGTEAAINRGRGLVADKDGNVYISDSGNRRIRKMTTSGWKLEGNPRDQLGNHSVNLMVDDGDGGTANQSFTITVSDTSPPEFTSGLSVDFAENEVSTVYTIAATDSNPNTTVTYSLGSDSDEALFTLIATGELIFKTAPDFETPADADGNNTYLVEVKASDGTNEASQLVVITVTNESDINPIFTSTPITSIEEDEVYTYQITTFDGDDDDMVITADNLPGWLSINTTDWVVSTLAGAGTAGLVNGQGTDAAFNNPYGLAVDSQDNIYVVENGNHTIRKVSPNGVVTTFAGSGTKESRDGTGILASFDTPVGIAIDHNGNLFVTENEAHKIKRIDPDGVVTTLAGSGDTGLDNGYGTYARFRNPWGLATDDLGNVYVADHGNHWIRKITPGGLVTTFAGSGTLGSADGIGTNATFNNPAFLAFDGNHNLYVTDAGNQMVRKITPEGLVTTLAGSGTLGDADGTGTEASFRNPHGVAVTSKGVVYVADQSNHEIRRISPEGVVTTVAGSATQGSADGTGTDATFSFPFGMAVDGNGNLYVSDLSNQLIRKIDGPRDFLVGDAQGQAGTYNVNLTVTDESNATGTQNFMVTVNGTSGPVFTSGTTATFIENSTETAYAAVATDVNAITYQLGNTGDEALFKIEAGNVSFLSPPDFENPQDVGLDNTYTIEVQANNGIGQSKQTVEISITDLDDESPVITSDGGGDTSALSVNENTIAVTTLTATDSDMISVVTFGISGGADQALFELEAGVLSFKLAPDFETPGDSDADNNYEVQVTATDGTNTDSQAITVTVTDSDEVRPGVILTSEADEIVRTSSFEVTVTFDEAVTDFDISDLVITNGVADDFTGSADSYTVDISPSVDGLVTVTVPEGAAVDAADNANTASNSLSRTLEVTNEAPTGMQISTSMVPENEESGFEVGDLTVTDVDAGDSHTWSLVVGEGDADNALFQMSENKLLTGASFDFESKAVYRVRVRATDTGSLSFEQAFEINVSDVDEAPTAIMLDNQSIVENEPAGTVIGAFSTTDQDANDTHSYTLTDGEGSADNNSFEITEGELVASSSFDFEEQDSYSIRVRTQDASGLFFEESFVIAVSNVAEAILRLSDAPDAQMTEEGSSTTFDITVFNDGDAPLNVISISYPEGFTGTESGTTVAAAQSETVTVTFSPDEAKTYTGLIAVSTNVGTQTIEVSGEGTLVTGIDDGVMDEDAIILYPNPAINIINIDLNRFNVNQPDIELISPTGLVLFVAKAVRDKELHLDVSTYQNGIYLMRFKDGKTTAVKRFLIRR